jgi:GNAT superfamily N-acetyltransferase
MASAFPTARGSNTFGLIMRAADSVVVRIRWTIGWPPKRSRTTKTSLGEKVLLDETGALAGYYTLATGQVDFGDLPSEVSKGSPRRLLPLAVLEWLGVNAAHQGQGLGRLLLAQALRDCYAAGKTFAFVAVILDCLNDAAKRFYQQWDFKELPGHPYRLFLSAKRLAAMMKA